MKYSETKKTLEKVLELLGSIDMNDTERKKCNQKYINQSYDILYDLRKRIIQEKRIKNIEKTTEK